MLNSETFLGMFSEVEKWLRRSVDADRTASFYELVRLASNNGVVRRYQDDLKEFADLRNEIVHERTDSHVIAEPNDRALSTFRRVRDALLNPLTIIPLFQRTVCVREAEHSIGDAVAEMRRGSFSQIPVLAGSNVVALLTAETIARWLGSQVENEIVSLWETRIATVLEHREERASYCFLSRRATLFDALARFESSAADGKDLDAVLISADGRANQGLLGILTVYDLPELLETLGLRRVSSA